MKRGITHRIHDPSKFLIINSNPICIAWNYIKPILCTLLSLWSVRISFPFGKSELQELHRTKYTPINYQIGKHKLHIQFSSWNWRTHSIMIIYWHTVSNYIFSLKSEKNKFINQTYNIVNFVRLLSRKIRTSLHLDSYSSSETDRLKHPATAPCWDLQQVLE